MMIDMATRAWKRPRETSSAITFEKMIPRKCFGIIVSKEIVVATTLKKVRMGLMYSLAKMTTLRKVESPP